VASKTERNYVKVMFIVVIHHTDSDTDKHSRGTQRRHGNKAATEQFQMLVQKDVLATLYKTIPLNISVCKNYWRSNQTKCPRYNGDTDCGDFIQYKSTQSTSVCM